MIKKFIKLLFITIIMFFMFVPSLTSAKNARVTDENGELISEQLVELNQLCDELSEKHQADICIAIISSTNGYDISDYANKIYEEYDYGMGDNYSGILLTIDMESRTYYHTTDINGICFNNITDYSITNLGNCFVDNYSSYGMYTALKQWILMVDNILTSAESGTVIDLQEVIFQIKDEEGNNVNATFNIYDENGSYWDYVECYGGYGKVNIAMGHTYTAVCNYISDGYIEPNDVVINVNSSPITITVNKKGPNYALTAGVGGGVGLLSALVYTGILKGKNKSVRKKYDASTYLRKGSFMLHPNSRDIFLYSQVSKTPIPKNDDNNHSSGHHSSGSSFSGSVGSRSGGRGGGSF